MQVLVIKEAFYAGARRRPGTAITVPDETKGSWFEVIKEPEPVKESDLAAAKSKGKGKSAHDGADLV